jgi:ribosomal protein S20
MKAKKPTQDWKDKAIAQGKGSGAPIVTQENYKSTLMAALGYYNTNAENSTRANALRKYIKNLIKTFDKDWNSTAELLKKIHKVLVDKVPDYELINMGSLCMIMENGGYISRIHTDDILQKVQAIYHKYNIEDVVDDKPKAPVISIDKRVIEAARTASEEIDYAIDRFIHSKVWDFNTKAHLLSNNISGMVAKRIGDYYKLNVDEIDEALEGKDEQLVEGYSFLTRTELKKFRAALQSIVDECAQHQVSVKKPRVTKAKPAAVIVKKLKYMFKHDLLNLKSINPADIVGSKELWVYNIKYRKLVAYVADDSDTLSVKGTTIINYSIAKSWSWTLRNPEKFFKDTQIGKRALNSAAKALTTKPTVPNGRINEETILLGAF